MYITYKVRTILYTLAIMLHEKFILLIFVVFKPYQKSHKNPSKRIGEKTRTVRMSLNILWSSITSFSNILKLIV